MAIEELQNGRYRHLRLLGTGGMGEVYLMQDMRVNRRVAIKVLRAEGSLYSEDEKAATSAKLFEREARAIAALDHPNILPLYDFGEEEREEMAITYMVMPYCADGSLEAWLRRRGGKLLAPRQVASLVEQAAEALDYAHEHKLVHLDVKPSNFLIRGNRKDPQRPTLLLADFGIARNFSTVSSSSRTIRGTPTSMAPEQWSGEPVFASDQYALAVMTYEMLVGRPPFMGTMEQLMYRHFTVPAPAPSTFNPRLPSELDAVLQRALSKKPEERYPSIVEFANALSAAAEQAEEFAEEEAAEYATLALSPSEAEEGISRLLTLDGGEEITVSVPAGVRDGQVLRVPGRSSAANEREGVVLVNIAVQPRNGDQSANVSNAQPLADALAEKLVERGEEDMETLAPSRQSAEALVESKPAPPKMEQVVLANAAHISLPEHDLPTVAEAGALTAAPIQLAPARRSRSRFGIVAIVSLLVVVLVLAGSLYAFLSHNATTTHTQGTPATTTHAGETATAASHSTSTPATTPTVGPGLYIAGTYNGSMSGSNGGQGALISVRLAQTQGSGVLTGGVVFNSTSTYPLHGQVDMQGNFSFALQQTSDGLPLLFYGSFQPGNFLHGDYCHTAAATCPASEGYFTVGPRQ